MYVIFSLWIFFFIILPKKVASTLSQFPPFTYLHSQHIPTFHNGINGMKDSEHQLFMLNLMPSTLCLDLLPSHHITHYTSDITNCRSHIKHHISHIIPYISHIPNDTILETWRSREYNSAKNLLPPPIPSPHRFDHFSSNFL